MTSPLKTPCYNDVAQYYDLFFAKHDDIAFYTDMAEKANGNILELCCGTGRLLLPIAQQGSNVTGIDVSEEMLKIAKAKIEQTTSEIRCRINLLQASMEEYSSETKFSLIIAAYSSLMEVAGAESRIKVLRCCYNNLKENGKLAFDNFFQGTGTQENVEIPCLDGALSYRGTVSNPSNASETLQCFVADTFNAEADTLTSNVFIDHIDGIGAVRRKTFSVCWHYVSPEQIKEELKEVGFSNVEIFGSFSRQPLYDPALNGNRRQVIVATK